MKHNSFQELVSRIIHLSTRDGKNLNISFSGTSAYTNQKSVNIPALPSGTILSPHQLSIWLGYVIHEGPGHQTHTDLDLYVSTCQKRQNPTFSYILNLLEDIRIENCDIAKYPGDRKYLDAVHLFVDQKISPQMANNPDIMGLIYKQLFVNHRNLDTNIIKGNLDPETSQLISQIDLCSSTQDVIHLADKVVNYLNNQKENQNEETKQKSNNTNSSQNNQTSENSESQGNCGKTNEEKRNERVGQQSSQQPNSQKGEENDNGSENSGDNSSDSDDLISNSNSQSSRQDQGNQSNNQSFDFSNQSINSWQEITEIKNIISSLKDQIEKINEQKTKQQIAHIPDEDLKNKFIFPPENILNDRIYVPSEEDLPTYTQTRNMCSSQILSLKKMFRIYLQAQTKKSTLRGLEEGKLDTQRLYVASTGSNLIFKDSSNKLLPETCIELMIDMSGSMDAHLSRTSAIILSEALSSIPQIKLSISGFTTNHFSQRASSPNSGRQTGMDILQFKNFSEPYAKCKSKLGAITNRGSTPLGDAYGKSLEHIINRPETRKIIFLITDGCPSFWHGSNHSDFLLMKKVHQTCQKHNIQTLGLGIGDDLDFLTKYFDKVVNINDPNDLPKNLLSALKFFI